ncbi:MAG: hypothetical protein HY722_00055 [Planctomycetes bacterium]|nr:hypothetical protein [Planctomycetota bacterium]
MGISFYRRWYGHARVLAVGFIFSLACTGSARAQSQPINCNPTFSAPPPPYCAPIDEGSTSGKSFWDNVSDALNNALQGLTCCRNGACPQHGGAPTPTPTPTPEATPEATPTPTPTPEVAPEDTGGGGGEEPAAPAEKPVIKRNPVKVYLEPEVYDG